MEEETQDSCQSEFPGQAAREAYKFVPLRCAIVDRNSEYS